MCDTVSRILFFIILLMPTAVYASNGSPSIPLYMAIFLEAFITIHMSLFVMMPISKIFGKDNYKSLFWKLFIVRIIFLLLVDILITPEIVILDFFALFIGDFLVVPICTVMKKASNRALVNKLVYSHDSLNSNPILRCEKCGMEVTLDHKFCSNCGKTITKDTSPIVKTDKEYLLSEREILRGIILEEIKLQGEDERKLISKAVSIKMAISSIVFGIFTLIATSFYFFNYSIWISIYIEAIAFGIYLVFKRGMTTVDFLIKDAEKNPDKNISELVQKVIENKKTASMSSHFQLVIILLVSIMIPCCYFYQPKSFFTKYEDGYALIKRTRGIKEEYKYDIPKEYHNKKVIVIKSRAFEDSSIQRITIPEGIQKIESEAFAYSDIKEIVIPSTVLEIGDNAFQNCNSLTNVILQEGIEKIGVGAFQNDINLVEISLPNSLEYLGESSFLNCKSLTSITIPNKVTKIYRNTFKNCTSLNKIHLHDDITSIQEGSFENVSSLESLTLPSRITEIYQNTFSGCSSLKTIYIPEEVEIIGEKAFYNCTNLNYVYLSKNVKKIDSYSFSRCYSLKDITVSNGIIIHENAFQESPTFIYYH